MFLIVFSKVLVGFNLVFNRFYKFCLSVWFGIVDALVGVFGGGLAGGRLR